MGGLHPYSNYSLDQDYLKSEPPLLINLHITHTDTQNHNQHTCEAPNLVYTTHTEWLLNSQAVKVGRYWGIKVSFGK